MEVFRAEPPLLPKRVAYLQRFNETRRMKRSVEALEQIPDPVSEAIGLPVGPDSAYFVGSEALFGQDLEKREGMIETAFVTTVPDPWLHVPVVVLGPMPPNRPTADAFVLVTVSNRPGFRFDLYIDEECCSFEDSLVWRDWIVIGFGHRLHFVSIPGDRHVSFDLGSYFGHLYPLDDVLLVASADLLRMFSPDVTLWWTSDRLGIDGVLVDDVDGEVIHGRGEWDPPGGWQPFSLDLQTGRLMPSL